MKNIFLTGKINSGKSTVVRKIIKKLQLNNEQLCGFNIRAYLEGGKVTGFYIEPINYSDTIPPMSQRMIGKCTEDGKWIGITKTFNDFGVKVLKYCIESKYEYVILDELGFFESDAENFQIKVHQLLSSKKIVIGVIKPLSISFMKSIRERKDVLTLEVTQSNRESLPEEICKLLRLSQ